MQEVFIKDFPRSRRATFQLPILQRQALVEKPFPVIGKVCIMHVAVDRWRLMLNSSILNSLGGGRRVGNKPARCFIAAPYNFCLKQEKKKTWKQSSEENVSVTIITMLNFSFS